MGTEAVIVTEFVGMINFAVKSMSDFHRLLSSFCEIIVRNSV